MMSVPSNDTQLTFNPRGLPFPMDAVTLGQMRNRQPELFDDRNTRRYVDAMAVHNMELLLCEKAFARKRGLPEPDAGIERYEIEDMLNDAYTRYGVSDGLNTTRALMQRLEAAASAQAEQGRGSR